MNNYGFYFTQILKYAAGSYVFLRVVREYVIELHRLHQLESILPNVYPPKNTEGLSKVWRWLNHSYVLTWKFTVKTLGEIHPHQLVIINHPLRKIRVMRYLAALEGTWIKDRKKDIFYGIPAGQCYVDSVSGDDDSSNWGVIPTSIIVGKPVVIFQPKNIMQFMNVVALGRKIGQLLQINERELNRNLIDLDK